MPCECPTNPTIHQLRSTNLTSEGAVGFIENILGGNFDAFAEVFAGEEEVEGWRSNDDFCVR